MSTYREVFTLKVSVLGVYYRAVHFRDYPHLDDHTRQQLILLGSEFTMTLLELSNLDQVSIIESPI